MINIVKDTNDETHVSRGVTVHQDLDDEGMVGISCQDKDLDMKPAFFEEVPCGLLGIGD